MLKDLLDYKEKQTMSVEVKKSHEKLNNVQKVIETEFSGVLHSKIHSQMPDFYKLKPLFHAMIGKHAFYCFLFFPLFQHLLFSFFPILATEKAVIRSLLILPAVWNGCWLMLGYQKYIELWQLQKQYWFYIKNVVEIPRLHNSPLIMKNSRDVGTRVNKIREILGQLIYFPTRKLEEGTEKLDTRLFINLFKYMILTNVGGPLNSSYREKYNLYEIGCV